MRTWRGWSGAFTALDEALFLDDDAAAFELEGDLAGVVEEAVVLELGPHAVLESGIV